MQIDERIRDSVRPIEGEPEVRDAAWVVATQEAWSAGRAPRRRSARVALIALAGLLAISGAALGASGSLRSMFGDDPASPANRMRVFSEAQDPDQALDVFNRPFREGDFDGLRLEPILVRMEASYNAEHPDRPAKILVQNARVAAELKAPEGSVKVIGAPLQNGDVCFGVWASYGDVLASCTDPIDHDLPIRFVGTTSPSGRALSAGIAIDSVEAVAVATDDGVVTDATMGENGFVWIASSAGSSIDHYEVTLKGGDRISVPIS